MKRKLSFVHIIALAVIGLTFIAASVIFLRWAVIYMKGHDIERDKTSDVSGAYYSKNVNVMLTCPDNWHKIESDLLLTADDFERIDGSTATIPITAELARQFITGADGEVYAYIYHNTTHPAYLALMGITEERKDYNEYEYIPGDTTADIIFVTEPSEDEKALSEKFDIPLDVTPVVLDGFVFITHKDNPVDSLTVEQIQGIYSGSITNWKEVGGEDAPIIPYQRERNSGSQTAMEQMVMKDVPLMDAPPGYNISGMGGLIEVVAEYENSKSSIGYTYDFYLNNLYKNDNVKVLAVNGISPANENLVSGEYPFTTSYYAVIRRGDDGMGARLRDFMLTPEGQAMVQQAGYCPIGDVNE